MDQSEMLFAFQKPVKWTEPIFHNFLIPTVSFQMQQNVLWHTLKSIKCKN